MPFGRELEYLSGVLLSSRAELVLRFQAHNVVRLPARLLEVLVRALLLEA